MKKIILIGGAPTTGKSTMAKRLGQHLGLPWMGTDYLRTIIKKVARKEVYQLLQMFHKRGLHYLDFQRTLSSFQYRMELNQLDVEELLRSYPNLHEHHVMLEVLREQGDLSMLMN